MSRAATIRVDPLEVRPRWLAHAALLLALVAGVAAMAALRRGGLDDDEDLLAAAVLAISFWVFALGLGGLVRCVRAGYALRLDGAGLHIPGLDVVPWRAVRAARLRTYQSSGKRFRQLIVDVDPAYTGASARHYERFLFGPIAGLLGKPGTIAIPVQLLAIDPESLLATTRAFIGVVETRATIRADVAASARERQLSGRRLP
jgi:hypothetical protein